jgi:hypothetical protein
MKKIEELVEERLQQKQANKEFKDVGRVANLKKTKAAYKLIDISNLSEIEKDEVEAFNIVKKDLVWLPIDVNSERERGVTSGAAFLKVKIRESVPTKPENSRAKRESYVLFLNKLQGDLLECYNVEQIKELSDKYLKYSIVEIISAVLDASFNQKTDEQKKEIEELAKKRFLGYSFYQGRMMKKILEDVFSKRFSNTLFNNSDASIILYKEAQEKEPITDEQSAILIEKLTTNKEKFISSNRAEQEKYRNFTVDELKNAMNTKWQISPMSKAIYKDDIEKFREWAINYYERQITQGVINYDKNIEKSKPKPNDWTWFEAEKPKSEKKSSENKLIINKKEPLTYIKRTGGYAIGEVTPEQLKTKFGYGAVNYGQYVDDLWSKQHTKFYLQAMSDLGELFNINIKELNELGNLGIVFGGKGTRGHLAAYYPQTKDINITKANGDGSVAHEYGHYFDNVVIDLQEKKAEPLLATESIGKVKNEKLKNAFQNILTFFYKGKADVTPKLTVQFYSQDIETAPTIAIYRNGWEREEVKLKDTIDETIRQYESLCVIDANSHSTQVRVFGYIIKQFGLKSYDIEMRLKTSLFYQKSAYNLFKYCYEIPSKSNPNRLVMEMGVDARTKYWTSSAEMFARAWETVMYKKLLDKSRRSDYLVSGIDMSDIKVEGFQNPYPAGTELEYLEKLYDELINVTKEVFNLSDFVAIDNRREDTLIEFESVKNSKISIGVDDVKDKNTETTTFIKDDKKVDVVKTEVTTESNELQEAIKTFEELIGFGGTDDEIKEWNEAIETFKMLI